MLFFESKKILLLWRTFDKSSGFVKINFYYRYLKNYAFKSVNEESLWSSLPTFAQHGAESQTLSKIINSWLYNDGLPELIIR